jgi:hypothetical protein
MIFRHNLTYYQKSLFYNAQYQWLARLFGLLLYPSLHLIGIPYIILWTPICVLCHHVAFIGQKKFLQHEIQNLLPENHEYTHFYFNVFKHDSEIIFCDGDIPFYKYLTNIIIKIPKNIIKDKDKCTNQYLKYNKKNNKIIITIPGLYLQENIKYDFDKIIELRRLRFKYDLSFFILTYLLWTYSKYALNDELSIFFVSFMTFICCRPILYSKYTNFYNKIQNFDLDQILNHNIIIPKELSNINIKHYNCSITQITDNLILESN